MASLFFPNPAALRLALASGLVPPEITRAPASAGVDDQGRVWLELAALLPRDSLAALHRLGVQVLGRSGVPVTPVRCWSELLPLVPAPASAPAGAVLFVVPDRALARFVARLRRFSRAPSAVQLADDAEGPSGWVTMSSPPAALLAEAAGPDAPAEAFVEQAPGVWVRLGWEHPLAGQLVVPPGNVLLLRPPRRVAAVPGGVPVACDEDFALARRPCPPVAPVRRLTLSVRLHLALRRSPEKETLWVLDAPQEAAFRDYCASADERLTRRLEACRVGCGNETRLVLRTVGRRPQLVLPFPVTGYASDPRLPSLFVPADRVLRPALRPRELADALGLAPTRLVWLEAAPDGGLIPHALPHGAFRPVADLLEYTVPARVAHSCPRRDEPFRLAKWPVVEAEAAPPAALAGPPPESTWDHPEPAGAQPARPAGSGWFVRSLRKLAARLAAGRARPAPPHQSGEPPEPTGHRAERKLPSPESLLHGRDWAARRRELETRLFRELPTLGPEGRAARWADLAGVYATTGNAADAAVCWMNAVWESPAPNPAWLEQWLAAECRAARFADQSGGLDRWLGEPGRPGAVRVVAAYTARAGFSPTPPAEFPAALRRILAFLDRHFDDLPVRAAWLARLAAARLCDGDVLGLARWRDRALARLAERGPGLDLDEPSFLRFHGTASADRFQTGREWLVRAKDPAVAWVKRHGGGRLRAPGLDAETEATGEYAQLMFAWGLGCLGERTRSLDWAGRARKGLLRVSGGADPAGHAVLADLFLLRVRHAQEGRAPKLGLPADLRDRLTALAPATRYAVDRLRQHSRILEPVDRVRAYRGLDLKVFWGTDRLAERLFLLAEHDDPADVGDEAEALIRLCSESPSTTTVPRTVLTLLEVASWLEAHATLRVLDLLPTALDWTEAWLAAGPWSEAERAERLVRYQARMIEAACSAAAALPAAVASAAVGGLARKLLAAGAPVRRPLLAAAGAVFRCLRRLRLSGEAEALAQFLDPGAFGPASAGLPPPARLGLAVGWFAAGDEDAGNRILNEAREALFLGEDGNDRARTELAIAYAEALGFAPPRIAHGRLEEMFQRPRFEVDRRGSTNRFFTLKPLQLIDAVVRSVVTDEFTLGPAVRGWLDDDEYLIRGRIHRDLAEHLRESGTA